MLRDAAILRRGNDRMRRGLNSVVVPVQRVVLLVVGHSRSQRYVVVVHLCFELLHFFRRRLPVLPTLCLVDLSVVNGLRCLHGHATIDPCVLDRVIK